MDMEVVTAVIDVLRALGVEDVCTRGVVEKHLASTGNITQVVVMPAIRVPQELIDISITTTIEHVLGALRSEYVAGGVTICRRSTASIGYIMQIPTHEGLL